jgi:flagellar L-ring protein FlgH
MIRISKVRTALFLLAATALSGCGTDFHEINKPPAMSPVGSGIDQSATGTVYKYPETPAKPVKKFSLWDDRQSRLFTDPRALRAGDILTVKIKIDDKAHLKNDSNRDRTATRTLGADLSLGWDAFSKKGAGNLDLNSKTDTDAQAEIQRSEAIDLNVAAVVTDVLPNGNLMIQGSQEMRVNQELRVLTIAGIVRPSDIGAENTIPYDRIAEARISYGGRGRLSEIQQPGYGQQILDQVLPY